jgi:hypothetical protein
MINPETQATLGIQDIGQRHKKGNKQTNNKDTLFTNENNMLTVTFVITIISRMLPGKSLIICMSLKYKATNVTGKNIVMFILISILH